MCEESVSGKMENWEAPIEFQKTSPIGFHAGKGIFLQSAAQLDEKDIYRHRINDSTFEMLGILTEVNNNQVSFPNIWYSILHEDEIFGKINNGKRDTSVKETRYFSINQADSILTAWGTGRK